MVDNLFGDFIVYYGFDGELAVVVSPDAEDCCSACVGVCIYEEGFELFVRGAELFG